MKTKKHLYTAAELFKTIMDQLKAEGKVPDHIDYALHTSDNIEFRDYAFDVLGCVNYGGSEGIYVDIFYRGDIGNSSSSPSRHRGEIGTIKTLETSDEAFRQMAVLMADFQIAATRFINKHIDDFTWTGFDVDYYEAGKNVSTYGITCNGVRTSQELIGH